MANYRSAKTQLLGWLGITQGIAALAAVLLYAALLPFTTIFRYLHQGEIVLSLTGQLLTGLTALGMIGAGWALLNGRPQAGRQLKSAAAVLLCLLGARLLLFGDVTGPLQLGWQLPLPIIILLCPAERQNGFSPRPTKAFRLAATLWLLLAIPLAALLTIRTVEMSKRERLVIADRHFQPAADPPDVIRISFTPALSVALPNSFALRAATAPVANPPDGLTFADDLGATITLRSQAMVTMLTADYLRLLGFRDHYDYLRRYYSSRFNSLLGGCSTARQVETIRVGPLYGFLTANPVLEEGKEMFWRFEIFSSDIPLGEVEMRGFSSAEVVLRIVASLRATESDPQ